MRASCGRRRGGVFPRRDDGDDEAGRRRPPMTERGARRETRRNVVHGTGLFGHNGDDGGGGGGAASSLLAARPRRPTRSRAPGRRAVRFGGSRDGGADEPISDRRGPFSRGPPAATEITADDRGAIGKRAPRAVRRRSLGRGRAAERRTTLTFSQFGRAGHNIASLRRCSCLGGCRGSLALGHKSGAPLSRALVPAIRARAAHGAAGCHLRRRAAGRPAHIYTRQRRRYTADTRRPNTYLHCRA